jgi:hypothetical protein
MASMNPTPYAVTAENHWRQLRPEDYAKIPPGERAEFFSRLGNEIEDQILARTEQLTRGQPPPEGGYMDSLASAMAIAREAKRQVLDEMLPAPEDTGDQETGGQQETAGT